VIAWIVPIARKISQKSFAQKGIRWMVLHFNKLIFGKTIFENDHLFVVRHPQPAYPVHCLILPKTDITTVLELNQKSAFWQEVPAALHFLVEKLIPSGDGYRIIANGGAYQEIPLLHLHFISGEPFENKK
jgi:diadenosine tetraphosphate (Ap4A) HIT family hydrolase